MTSPFMEMTHSNYHSTWLPIPECLVEHWGRVVDDRRPRLCTAAPAKNDLRQSSVVLQRIVFLHGTTRIPVQYIPGV